MKMKWKRITFVLALAMTFAMGGMTGKAMAADLVVNEQNFPSEWLRNLMKTPLYDVNGDGIIDANDKTAIGYSTTAPEIYYSFHLGAEWKGIGVDVMFQGTGNYSAVLNTKSMFWPLINNTTLSTHYYENRWTPENQNAKYPRLSSQSNANNYQANTVWLADRSFLKLRNAEVYYRFPKELMKKTKILGSAKLYVRGTDLFCSDHIDVADPECYGVATPLNKSVVVGVTIGF